MKSWIDNKCVIVTGASSGIGKELAKNLILKYNCQVIAVARTEQKLLQTQKEIENLVAKNYFLPCAADVSKKEDWQKILKLAKQHSASLVFNNAGTMLPFIKATKTTNEEVERVLNTNFYSIYYCLSTFNDYFEKSNTPCGIINITSSSASYLIPGQAVYSASKAAATKLSLIAASEQKKKYFIGTYLPGLTKTNIFYSKDNPKNILTGATAQKVVNKFGASSQKIANKIIKLTIKKKMYKVIGLDSKLLKLLKIFSNTKMSGVLLNIFKKSKDDSFSDLF